MGGRKLDKIIVIDLEATAWENEHDRKNQPSEIVEIGVCFLNVADGSVSKKTSYIIKPSLSKVSDYFTTLTGLTEEILSAGIPFSDAINKLKKEFGPANRTWASWGCGDRSMLMLECSRRNIDYPMGKNHINIKNLYALHHKLPHELGLIHALEHSSIEHIGKHHSGCDDAHNAAELLKSIIF